MKLQDRLSDVLNYTGLSRSALAQKIGVKAYKLQDISRGQTVRMPSDVLDGLSREFPDLNPTWLLTGEGEMLLPDEEDNRLGQLTAGNASGVKGRLKEYIKYSGITTMEFERSIGASNGYVTSISKGIGAKFSREISKNYPDLNLDWLLTGEGSMLKSADEATTPEALMPGNAVTFHPGLTAQAGYVDMPGEEDDSTELFFIKGYEGCHAIRAVGDSMYPTITNGDIVIHEMNTERYIRNGEVYIVVDELGALMVKRVTQDVSPEDEITFTFFSDNPNQAKYKPFSIPGEQIKRLYRVRAVIKQLT